MFSVDWEERPKLTGVPDAFIQGVMKDAPGEYVKVFLYLLMLSRQPDARISLQNLAGFFGCSESEIQAALQYWEKLHVMDLYYRSGELTGVRFTMSAAEKVRETHRLNQTRIKKLMQDNNDAARLLYVTEQYFGRPLTSIEISTLLYFLDELRFSFDLCDYLVQYCISRGHTGIRYIEKVGLAWHKNGYTTPEEAKAATTNWTRLHFDVLKAFGIRDRNPVPREIETVDRWYRKYGFSEEMICEACSIALKATGKPSFEYAEAILSRWRNDGIHTLAEAQKQEEGFRARQKEKAAVQPAQKPAGNQFHNFEQRSDDLAELERKLDRQFAENV